MITVKRAIHFQRESRGRKRIAPGPARGASVQCGGIPRISRLMALAIRFQGLIRERVVADQSELARLAHVTQPRITQIMNLLHLAPDIQEELLWLPRLDAGRGGLTEQQMRPIAAQPNWAEQRVMWRRI